MYPLIFSVFFFSFSGNCSLIARSKITRKENLQLDNKTDIKVEFVIITSMFYYQLQSRTVLLRQLKSTLPTSSKINIELTRNHTIHSLFSNQQRQFSNYNINRSATGDKSTLKGFTLPDVIGRNSTEQNNRF